MCPTVQLTCEEFRKLLDMLISYLEEHEHDIEDYGEYWEEEIELVERLNKFYKEMCKKDC